MAPHYRGKLFVDGLAGCRVFNILAFINELLLDPEGRGIVFHDVADDVVGGLGGVVMADKLCLLVEGRFEIDTVGKEGTDCS